MLKGFRQPSLLLMNILYLLMRLYTVNGCLEFANSGCKLGIATIAVPKSQLGILYAYLSRTLSNSAGYYFLRTTWESWRGDCNSSTCELEITKNNLKYTSNEYKNTLHFVCSKHFADANWMPRSFQYRSGFFRWGSLVWGFAKKTQDFDLHLSFRDRKWVDDD